MSSKPAMKKLLLALPLVLLTACSGPETKVEETDLSNLPTYCIRETVDNGDGTVTVDMPGLYHGQDDAPIQMSLVTYDTLDVPFCEAGDPRLAK
jgi:hypothetical protein